MAVLSLSLLSSWYWGSSCWLPEVVDDAASFQLSFVGGDRVEAGHSFKFGRYP